MFPYDGQLAACTQSPPQSIPDVLQLMQNIDGICNEKTDGLTWFNRLYLQVTQAVENRVEAGGFQDGPWLAVLDVQFASLYFQALHESLTGGPCPECWQAMFAVRAQPRIARIQFALAGMNAHINHDLPFAIVATCKQTGTVPTHSSQQYADFTSVNTTLNGLIDQAKKELNVRLPGDPLPDVSHLEDLFAAWNLADFREQAWRHAETLWQGAISAAILKDAIDFTTAFASKALLVPVP